MGNAAMQGGLWGARPQDWVRFESAFRPLYEAVLDATNVTRGTFVLDVGCGAGLALSAACDRGAQVAGVDAARTLIAIAKQRLPQADLQIGELEELPFPDGRFDVVMGLNSFSYAEDRSRALAEAKRVTTDGGSVVAAVWGAPEECDLAAYIAALGKLAAPPPAGAPGPWSLSPTGALESLMKQAGLTPVSSQSLKVIVRFHNEVEAINTLLAPAPATRAIRHSGEAATASAVAKVIEGYRKSDGSFAFENTFRFVIARTCTNRTFFIAGSHSSAALRRGSSRSEA